MNQQLTVRPCIESDWPAVWAIIRAVAAQADTFTYPTDISADFARAIWMEKSPGLTVVATDQTGGIVGTAKMHRNQMGPGSHVATASFMVAAAARRCGVGRTLAEFALSWAADQGYQAMQFNAVVETNLSAVQLWQRLGFQIIGTIPRAFRHARGDYVGLHVMHRFLSARQESSAQRSSDDTRAPC